jgi:diadenosine tetraphosphatase ApaH/serine/threonine PP2A family protein phosphatase
MRLALLTDLHANREALEACLAHAERRQADAYAFLGDFVGNGADPAWVVDTLMDYVAVGQPRDHDNAAGYAIFDDATREICYYRVPYDHGAAARKVIAAGLPIVFAMRLVEGI